MAIRVANIIEEGKLGGPQIRVMEVARALYGRIETTVVMPISNSGDFQRRCKALGIRHERLAISRITREWRVACSYCLMFPSEIIQIMSLIRRHDFDLVHVSGGSWQIKGIIAAKLVGKKVIWHLNDSRAPFFIRSIFRILSPLADGFIFASQRSEAYYKGLIRTRAKAAKWTIPAPVDCSKFLPNGLYNEDQKLIAEWSGKIVIGTVANINPIKGIEYLIQVANKLKHSPHSLHFVIVGPVYDNQRSYFNRLTRLSSSLQLQNIQFVGGRSDVRSLLQRFDIYVCTSRAESSPLSVWEAMAMAKPIVSTDVGDVPLYVRDRDTGFVVGVGDVDAMSSRIENLLENVEMRKIFGLRARSLACSSLSVEKCAELHDRAYRAIL